MLVHVKARVHPWIRLNRVVRDIPIQYVSGGLDVPNLREDVLSGMGARGLTCRCIRCREVGGDEPDPSTIRLLTRGYEASAGSEIFLSFESRRCDGGGRAATPHAPASDLLLGFLRLRLPNMAPPPHANGHAPARAPPGKVVAKRGPAAVAEGEGEDEMPFDELRGAALVREVHVYGQLIATSDKVGAASQHVGFGGRLLAEAERLARAHGCRSVAVIAGVGSRNYYRKFGYELHAGDGQFMIKDLGLLAPGWGSHVVRSPALHVLSALAALCLAAAAAGGLLASPAAGPMAIEALLL